MEETLAPTVVESHVPERTQRRGELRRRTSVREEDNGFFFVPSPRRDQERTKPDFQRGVTESSRHKEEGSEGLDPQVFFCFSFLFLFP